MTREEVKQTVWKYLQQSLAKQEIEHAKFEVKTTWYKLKQKKDISEFIKDTSAMANTFGPDGFIVIGYNHSERKFTPARFSDCGLKDVTDLRSLVNKRVEQIFDFELYDVDIEGKLISIIHIPPSLTKPHVIKNYQTFNNEDIFKREEQHRIFVRKTGGVAIATKYDIDLMYYDQKNITPDYRVIITVSNVGLNINPIYSGSPRLCQGIEARIPLTIENVGKRPVSLSRMLITLPLLSTDQNDKLHFVPEWMKTSPLILKPGELVAHDIKFISGQYNSYQRETVDPIIKSLLNNRNNLLIEPIICTMTTGISLTAETFIGNP